MSKSGPRSTRGFTLLEVLVALLILALALVALIRTTSLEARAFAHVRDATLAQWVAANALAEVRLAEPLPALGRRDGGAEMGGRRWRWVMDVSATDEPAIRRMEVSVHAEEAGARRDAEPVVRLTGFSWR